MDNKKSRISLANLYRPKEFSDVVEQNSTVKILSYMIENKDFPNCMLFTGSAGTGKTSTARIVANKINNGLGNPIEIDAASNNSVENVRRISEEAKFKSLDSEYKIYILDEVHALSSSAWQALLKLFEEPPAKTIFILCTTDPQKIPNTILSRVQRFDFSRITFNSIVKRLNYIVEEENKRLGEKYYVIKEKEALEYIAKLADGGMRDAITNLDKCLSYDNIITVESVSKVLGIQDYEVMFNLTDFILDGKSEEIISIIEDMYLSGKDLKQFLKQYIIFLLDLCKFRLLNNYDYIQIPQTYEKKINYGDEDFVFINKLRNRLVKLQSSIKWENSPKVMIECEFLDICIDGI